MTKLLTMNDFLNDEQYNQEILEIDFEIIDAIEDKLTMIGKDCMDIILDFKYQMELKERMKPLMKELRDFVSVKDMFVSYDYERYESMDNNVSWSDFNYLNINQNAYVKGITNIYKIDDTLFEIDTKEEFYEIQDEHIKDKMLIKDTYRIFEGNYINIFYKNGEYIDMGDFGGRFYEIDY